MLADMECSPTQLAPRVLDTVLRSGCVVPHCLYSPAASCTLGCMRVFYAASISNGGASHELTKRTCCTRRGPGCISRSSVRGVCAAGLSECTAAAAGTISEGTPDRGDGHRGVGRRLVVHQRTVWGRDETRRDLSAPTRWPVGLALFV